MRAGVVGVMWELESSMNELNRVSKDVMRGTKYLSRICSPVLTASTTGTAMNRVAFGQSAGLIVRNVLSMNLPSSQVLLARGYCRCFVLGECCKYRVLIVPSSFSLLDRPSAAA